MYLYVAVMYHKRSLRNNEGMGALVGSAEVYVHV